MVEFVLDTNICIYIIRQKPVEVFEKFKTLNIGSVGLSVITLSELNYGVEKSAFPGKNFDALRRFVTPLEILDFDQNAAFEYGKIRTYLEKQGAIIGSMDLLIAAHTKSINACLVTNNMKEFSRIPELKIENWVHHKE
jgi:tRNA(fMet)-specific endonuclease VapC